MKIDKGTIARTIALVLAFANQTVALIGSSGFASALWYQILSLVITIAAAGFSWWYNNDITKLAKIASAVFDAMKDGKISVEEVNELLKKSGKEDSENADK